jgi:hypothetical protein
MKNNKDKSHLVDVTKLDKSLPGYEEIMALHKRAIEKNEDIYIDLKTGFQVFTAAFLLEKGYCCGSGCRHCPY